MIDKNKELGNYPQLTSQSKAILEILQKSGLTSDEVARVRGMFEREDNTSWAIKFLYNAVIKLAILLGSIGTIYTILSNWGVKFFQ